VPSKSFGELVEQKFNTPSITASQLSQKQKEGKDIIILDGRPFDEYNKMSIPGSVCCPNAEIPFRISEIIKSSNTEIIINCAGRTRSIIGAQTLINFGIKNKVFALENGTQGWFLANLKLDHRKTKFLDKTPKNEKIYELREKIVNLLENKVEIIDFNQAQKLINDKNITSYVFDVRTYSNQKNKLSKLRNVPGGQLVQATDKYIGVLKSHVILFDDGDLVRAGMTALWLKKMNYHCYVINESPKKIKNLNLIHNINFKTSPINLIKLENLKTLKNIPIFDIRNSVDYCKKRIKKSVWTNRLIITNEIPHNVKCIILVSTVIAVGIEIYKMFENRSVTLADLLLMFLYLEVLAMVRVFWNQQSISITLPLLIAITALARFIILQGKEMDPSALVYEAVAIVLIAGAIVILRLRHSDKLGLKKKKSK